MTVLFVGLLMLVPAVAAVIAARLDRRGNYVALLVAPLGLAAAWLLVRDDPRTDFRALYVTLLLTLPSVGLALGALCGIALRRLRPGAPAGIVAGALAALLTLLFYRSVFGLPALPA